MAAQEHMQHFGFIRPVTHEDGVCLEAREMQYQASWKKRGGIGAFMMLARKWDRIEAACKNNGYDIFKAIEADSGPEGLIDDIRDLRGYLVLSETEMRLLGIVSSERPHISQRLINTATENDTCHGPLPKVSSPKKAKKLSKRTLAQRRRKT